MSTQLRTSGSGIELTAKPVAFFENHEGARIGFALLNLAIPYETKAGKRVTISQTTANGNLVLNVFANQDGTYGFTVFGGRIQSNSELGILLAQMAETALHHDLHRKRAE